MKGIEPLAGDVKALIKATFPWAILVFSCLYSVIQNKNIFLSIRQYVGIMFLYAILSNVFLFSKGKDVFVSLNLSTIYFIILLTVFWNLSKLRLFFNQESGTRYPLSRFQDRIPPVIYRLLETYLPRAQAYIKEKPSAPFIIGFMILLIICAFLLIFKHEKTAERAANIAYFSLVIGVGKEVCQLIKYGQGNEKE